MATCGAIPGKLIDYSRWACGKDDDLRRQGRTFNQIVEAMQRSGSDPAYLTLGYADLVGNDVVGFGTRYHVTDTWVGQVGNAFLQAAMAGLPAAERAKYWETFLNQPVTVDESQVASVGDEPVATAEDDAQAAELALLLQEADDNHDGQEIQLVLDELAKHQDDPAYTAEFFNDLGPGYTMQTLSLIFDDPAELQVFDQALATASNSTLLDPDFERQLWDWNSNLQPPMSKYERASLASHLLDYGVYSESFLFAAADAYVRHNPGVPGHWYSTVMEALARNPLAATDYLRTTIDGRPMVQELALLADRIEYMDPQAGASFGDLLYAAVVTSPNADVDHMKILQELGGLSYDQLPDGARDALGRIIVTYLPELTSWVDESNSGQTLTWQEHLFAMAERLSDGSAYAPGFQTIQEALSAYVQAGPPKGMDWRVWVNHVGQLYGLAELPISQAYQHHSDSVNSLLTWSGDGVSILEVFFPTWAGPVISIGVNHAFVTLEGNNQSAANTAIGNLQDSTKAALNQIIARQIYASEPDIVPRSVRDQGQEAVDRFLNQLADPATPIDQFSDTPTRDAWNAIRAMDDEVDQAFVTKNTGQG